MANLADVNLRRENLARKPIELSMGLEDPALNNSNKVLDISTFVKLVREDVQEFSDDILSAIEDGNKDQAKKIIAAMRDKIEQQGKTAAYLSPSEQYCEQRQLQRESKAFDEQLVNDTHIQLIKFKHEIKGNFGKESDVNNLVSGLDEMSKLVGYKVAIINQKLLDQVEYNYSEAKMNNPSSILNKDLNKEVNEIAQTLKEQGVKPAGQTSANPALPNQQYNSNKDKSL